MDKNAQFFLSLLATVLLLFFSQSVNASESADPRSLVHQSLPLTNWHNNSLTNKVISDLPESIKSRMPQHLSKSDSAILSIDVITLTSEEKSIIAFDNGKIQATIIKAGKYQYRIVNEEEELLAVVRKSKDGKHYTMMNSKGGLIFSSEVGYGLMYGFITLISLLTTLIIYVLIYNSIAA